MNDKQLALRDDVIEVSKMVSMYSARPDIGLSYERRVLAFMLVLGESPKTCFGVEQVLFMTRALIDQEKFGVDDADDAYRLIKSLMLYAELENEERSVSELKAL